MFGYNLRLNLKNNYKWTNSKELYSPERHKIIDKYRDGCTRNPCCRDIVNKKKKVIPKEFTIEMVKILEKGNNA